MPAGVNIAIRAIDQYSDQMNKAESAVGRLGGTLKKGAKIGAAAIAVIGAAAASFGAKAIQLASDAAETASLIENSLGPAAKQFNDRVNEIADASNRSSTELKEGSATIIAMARNMGMAQDQTATFAGAIAQAAPDLGSFFNVADNQVFADLQAALGGSSETMQKYGIDVRETTLKQMALNQGLIQNASDVLPRAQRAQLLFQAVVSQAGDALGTTGAEITSYQDALDVLSTATGDAERTSTSWQNTIRGVQSTIKDTTVEIGSTLIPIFDPLLQKIANVIDDVGPRLADWLSVALPAAIQTAADFWTGTLEPAIQMGIDIFNTAKDIGVALFETIQGKLAPFQAQFEATIGLVSDFISGEIEAWTTFFSDFFSALTSGDITGAIDAFKALITDRFGNVTEFLGGLADTWGPLLVDWISTAIETIGPKLVEFAGKITSWATEKAGEIATKFTDEWLPAFLGWASDAVADLTPKLVEFAGQITTWATEKAGEIATKFTDEWLPAFLGWASDAVADLTPKLVEFAGTVTSWATEKAGEIATKFTDEWLPAFLGWASDAVADLTPKLVEFAGTVTSWATEKAGEIATKFTDEWLPAFTDWISDVGPKLLEKASDLAAGLLSLATEAISNVSWEDVGAGLVSALMKAVKIALGTLKIGFEIIKKVIGLFKSSSTSDEGSSKFGEAAGALGSALLKAIKGIAKGVWSELGTAVITPIGDAIKKLWEDIKSAFKTMLTDAINNLKNDLPSFSELGTAIKDGIVSGITGLGSAIFEAGKSAISEGIDNLKFWQRQGSPSRLWAEELGIPAGLGYVMGIVEGLEAGEIDILNAAVDLISNISDAFQSAFSTAGLLTEGMPAVEGGSLAALSDFADQLLQEVQILSRRFRLAGNVLDENLVVAINATTDVLGKAAEAVTKTVMAIKAITDVVNSETFGGTLPAANALLLGNLADWIEGLVQGFVDVVRRVDASVAELEAAGGISQAASTILKPISDITSGIRVLLEEMPALFADVVDVITTGSFFGADFSVEIQSDIDEAITDLVILVEMIVATFNSARSDLEAQDASITQGAADILANVSDIAGGIKTLLENVPSLFDDVVQIVTTGSFFGGNFTAEIQSDIDDAVTQLVILAELVVRSFNKASSDLEARGTQVLAGARDILSGVTDIHDGVIALVEGFGTFWADMHRRLDEISGISSDNLVEPIRNAARKLAVVAMLVVEGFNRANVEIEANNTEFLNATAGILGAVAGMRDNVFLLVEDFGTFWADMHRRLDEIAGIDSSNLVEPIRDAARKLAVVALLVVEGFNEADADIEASDTEFLSAASAILGNIGNIADGIQVLLDRIPALFSDFHLGSLEEAKAAVREQARRMAEIAQIVAVEFQAVAGEIDAEAMPAIEGVGRAIQSMVAALNDLFSLGGLGRARFSFDPSTQSYISQFQVNLDRAVERIQEAIPRIASALSGIQAQEIDLAWFTEPLNQVTQILQSVATEWPRLVQEVVASLGMIGDVQGDFRMGGGGLTVNTENTFNIPIRIDARLGPDLVQQVADAVYNQLLNDLEAAGVFG